MHCKCVETGKCIRQSLSPPLGPTMLGTKISTYPIISFHLNPPTMIPQTPNPRIYTQQTPNAGTGVFAAKDILSGELIFRIDRPLVSALDSPHLKDTCYNCYLWVPEEQRDEEDEDGRIGMLRLKACTGCRVSRYCGKVGFHYRVFNVCL